MTYKHTIPDNLVKDITTIVNSTLTKDRTNDEADIHLDLQEWQNNQYFLNNSHINYRLNSELIYTYFDFSRNGSIYTNNNTMKSTKTAYGTVYDGFKSVLILETGNITSNIARELSTIFSRNTMDLSIPGQSQSFVTQNIGNVRKNYNTSLDVGTKNSATIKIIESNNLNISRIINYILYINHNPDKNVLRIYPDSLKFNVYSFPLFYNADQGGIMDFSRSNSMIGLIGCQFIGFNDWDFDISGSKNNIIMKDVSINYEKMYVTSTRKGGPESDKNW